MSLAEHPAIKRLPEPRQKWYLFIPENWVQLAFDRNWRTKWLTTLAANSSWRHQAFWFIAGLALFMLLPVAVGGWLNSGSDQTLRVQLMFLMVSGTMMVQLVIVATHLVMTELERLALQIIEHLETDDVDHD